ncbi:hypothetical protein F503_07266 [Ophiostoma piceae UAMH 11346]|uniref:DUF7924 domain-containing protein n=1 Tax=Ophiostoma piceae (strain UAMH 11346) TaxID=1262450 RepID=S3D7T5_OPHP1|nr:hypothetical protein F503_07266 [Ophiostoma piceae UAMH 11346]
MAGQTPNRQHVDHSDTEPPTNKTKAWQYPPEFWDRLSKISLTHLAIKEHNRRVRLQQHSSLLPPVLNEHFVVHALPSKDLVSFARHGGPDLSDLRGFRQPFVAMSANDSTSTLLTSATTKSPKSKKSTPYNRDFDLHLTDHGVRPLYSSQSPNLSGIQEALAAARPSPTLSLFSEAAFRRFQQSDAQAKDEDDVVAHILPTILGPHQPARGSARNTIFKNLEPLTDGTIAPAVPDIYDGAHPEDLSQPIRNALGHHIMPSTMQDKPLAPNFFVEAKGPNGSTAVAIRQVRYAGAVGSRAMHSLQNYGEEEPKYDSESYAFSFIYHDGQLKLYAHHTTAPTSERGRPEYHMTQVDTWGMTGNINSFRRGATAFRNARDMAQRHRDSFIQAANARALHSKTSASQDVTGTPEESDTVIDCSDWRLADEKLQQYIAAASRDGV